MDVSDRSALSMAIEGIERGDWAAARAYAEAALADSPESPAAHHVLGTAYWQTGDTGIAIRHLEESVSLSANPTWLSNLGVAYAGLNRWTEACETLERSLALDPVRPDTLAHYGRTLCELGRFGAAREVLEQAVTGNPDEAGSWTDLGWALSELGALEESRAAFLRALKLYPAMRRAVRKLVRVCDRLGRLKEAVVHARMMAALEPAADSFTTLALALWKEGEIEAALKAGARGFSFDVTNPDLHSALLYLMLFDPDQSGQTLVDAHRRWGVKHAPQRLSPPTFESRTPRRGKLRLGYISASLFSSPAQHSRLPLLVHADTGRFDVFNYGTQPISPVDESGCAGLPGTYRNVHSLSCSEVLRMIREDEIDILVDLIGHHSFGRLRVFAERAAPLQISYSTYPATSGVADMDYFLSDPIATPPCADNEYVERVWRMPSGFLMYNPPAASPDVMPLPALANGHITFGLFQREAKLNGRCWDAIAAVLRAIPHSRLLVHHEHPALDDENSEPRQRVTAALEQRGVSGSRVDFKGGRFMEGHLASIAEADLALDAFPYNGHATTCECLWMGVPVVTLRGDRHAARVGASILTEAGLEEWIAHTTEEYVQIACRWAASRDELASRRTALRGRFAACGMTDPRARTRAIEDIYCQAWQSLND